MKGTPMKKKEKASVQSNETKAKLGKYATLHGVAATRRHFKAEMSNICQKSLQENIINLYTAEVSARAKKWILQLSHQEARKANEIAQIS